MRNSITRLVAAKFYFYFNMIQKLMPIGFIAAAVTALLFVSPGFALAAGGVLRMATTTSTRNSGLLDHLLPPFEKKSGLRIHIIAVGTGKALRLGESGDVDLVMVHAPEKEKAYMAKGAFVMRRTLMHNFFVLLGPANDPAQVQKARDIRSAMTSIASHRARFISRGDESGTHTKELKLWKAAGLAPEGEWYEEVGQGMGRALIIANERQAYLLSDDSTFYAFKARLSLKILSHREPLLRNVYSAMAVNPKKHPHVRHRQAVQLIDWLIGEEGQRRIASYRRSGRQLFTPVLEAAR